MYLLLAGRWNQRLQRIPEILLLTLLRAHVGDHRDELGAVVGWFRHFGGCGHESLL